MSDADDEKEDLPGHAETLLYIHARDKKPHGVCIENDTVVVP
jgi:hypothetical protein